MAVTEGEIEGKCLPGGRRTAWIRYGCDRGRDRGKVFTRWTENSVDRLWR